MHDRRVLVVAAHPDDPEFGFGASIASLVASGGRVTYVICTDGAQGGEDPAQPDRELIEIREREQRSAADTLGVADVTFLGLPDGHLSPNLDLRRAITREIRRSRPDLVLTHNPTRAFNVPIGASHPDHLAVGEATMSAVYPDARNPRAFRELLAEGLDAHRVREVWVPGFDASDHFVDATEFLDQKIKAILCHRSQFQSRPDFKFEDLRKWIEERMRKAGEQSGHQYAEAFQRIEIT